MLKAIKKRLNQFHDFYFGDKSKPKPDIIVGGIFTLGRGEEEKDPFERAMREKNPSDVKILAIQDGYVQYERGASTLFNPDSMEIGSFLHCYRKKK